MAASSDDPGPSGERRFEIKSLGELGSYIYTHIYIITHAHTHIYASPSNKVFLYYIITNCAFFVCINVLCHVCKTT